MAGEQKRQQSTAKSSAAAPQSKARRGVRQMNAAEGRRRQLDNTLAALSPSDVRLLVLRRRGDGGAALWLPEDIAPVPVVKLQKGLAAARDDLQGILGEIVETFTEDYRIAEIELSVSFNAEGKFLGIGIGGEASITVRIAPTALAKH